jgi:integrase/recombinase XerD
MLDQAQGRDRYLKHLEVLGYSPATVKAHGYLLRRFFGFLTARGVLDLGAVTREDVAGYQVHLHESLSPKGTPLGVGARNNALKVVKALYRHLKEEDYLATDPAREVRYARTPKPLPRSVLSVPEVKKLLRAPDTGSVLGYRDRAVLEVLYSTGIRRQELINLKLEDLDLSQGLLRVNLGKGAKDRVVPLGRIACRILDNYLHHIRPRLLRDPFEVHVFLSLGGRKLGNNTAWEIVRRTVKKTKLDKSVSPHSFRHTCATLMLRNQANIRHIQELLGHSSLNTTQVYAHVSVADLKAVHEKCHPREKDQA